jgi:hypothetical protein
MDENIIKFIEQNENVVKMAKKLCACTSPDLGLRPLVEYVAELTALFAGVLAAYTATFADAPISREKFVEEYLNGIKREVLSSPSKMN